MLSHYCVGDLKCKECAEKELGLLTIDHLNGGGNKHRKNVGVTTAGYGFYLWLKRNNYPEGYQVLCWNCQYRKRKVERPNKNQKSYEYSQKIKKLCMDNYGGTCPCGENDLVVLTLDHVNDDGANHRRETNTKGFAFYLKLKREGFPKDPPLQVLCMNCQYRKRFKLGQRENRPADGNQDSAVAVS